MTKRYTTAQLDELIETVKQGEVIAFATDTVFGLGCLPTVAACKKMIEVKGRDEKKPFPVMIGNLRQIEEIAEVTPLAKKIMERFMPGALTLVLNKKAGLADELTGGKPTVAIRMPDDAIALAILEKTGPLLVTSANQSGGPTPQTDEEVLAQLDGRFAAILLGRSGGQTASTIVDVTGQTAVILRQGPISEEDLKSL